MIFAYIKTLGNVHKASLVNGKKELQKRQSVLTLINLYSNIYMYNIYMYNIYMYNIYMYNIQQQ